MSKYQYSDSERQVNKVLKRQAGELENIEFPDLVSVDASIASSEELLRKLGIDSHVARGDASITLHAKKALVVPSWEELCAEAEREVAGDVALEDLFTAEELAGNELAVKMLNDEYNALHSLDRYDVAISVVAGLVASIVDILLVGVPHRTADGLRAAPLSDYVREYFDNRFPEADMEKLANSKVSKVPFDAQDNRNTTIRVEGLSAYYHRLLSLGHDPILGFVFGVADILNGTMTTIDKGGKIAVQVMANYADRTEADVFAAIAKQIVHLKSDITTSMGLPAPMMGLFNLLQFGSIGETEQTIAAIVQGMYYEGYDFIHFCSQSIPVMILEVIIRLGYAFKCIKEGHRLTDSIPFSLDREKYPKLATMLFIGHAAATAVNAGKVCFSKNPMDINYPQWLTFAKYAYTQAKWAIVDKPSARDAYVSGRTSEELSVVYDEVDKTFLEVTRDYVLVIG